MLFRGTPEVSSGGLDDIVARLGAQMNGETNYDYTQFYFEMPADKLDVALYLDADRMQHAALRAVRLGDRAQRRAQRNRRRRQLAVLQLARARPRGGLPGSAQRTDAARQSRRRRARDRRRHRALLSRMVRAEQRDARRRRRRRSRRRSSRRRKRYFGAIPSKQLPARPQANPVAARGQTVEAQFPFPFEILDLAYSIPGDMQRGEPAMSTLATLLENQRSPFYRALVQSNIALAIEANADTQLRGGLLDVFIVLNPGQDRRRGAGGLSVDARTRCCKTASIPTSSSPRSA